MMASHEKSSLSIFSLASSTAGCNTISPFYIRHKHRMVLSDTLKCFNTTFWELSSIVSKESPSAIARRKFFFQNPMNLLF